MSLGEKIRHAAEVLDKVNPGWEHKITRPIQFPSTKDCVLGQLYGYFTSQALHMVRGADYEAFRCYTWPYDEVYREMSALWNVEVQLRRAFIHEDAGVLVQG